MNRFLISRPLHHFVTGIFRFGHSTTTPGRDKRKSGAFSLHSGMDYFNGPPEFLDPAGWNLASYTHSPLRH
jgi:hypothetical protein